MSDASVRSRIFSLLGSTVILFVAWIAIVTMLMNKCGSLVEEEYELREQCAKSCFPNKSDYEYGQCYCEGGFNGS